MHKDYVGTKTGKAFGSKGRVWINRNEAALTSITNNLGKTTQQEVKD